MIAENTQLVKLQPAVAFIISDGPHFNPETNDFDIYLDGDPVGFGYKTRIQAWNAYHELLEVNRTHLTRNPANRTIPVYTDGKLAVIIKVDWTSCPDCGTIIDLGQTCPDCQLAEEQ